MSKPTHTCYSVINRGEDRDPFWHVIGSAWTNKDGSLNLTLESLPLDGKITVRVRKEKDNAQAEA